MESPEGFQKNRVFVGPCQEFAERDATLAGSNSGCLIGLQLPCRIVRHPLELGDFTCPRIFSGGRALYFDGLSIGGTTAP
jgi:hypothetical protein